MNHQEIFNKVAEHLLTQNAKAMLGEECVYRSEDGCRCAIGCLIPDELYRPEFEGKNVDGLCAVDLFSKLLHDDEYKYKYPLIAKHLLGAKPNYAIDLRFLARLQAIHDYESVGAWLLTLKRFAHDNKLNHNVVDRFSK